MSSALSVLHDGLNDHTQHATKLDDKKAGNNVESEVFSKAKHKLDDPVIQSS